MHVLFLILMISGTVFCQSTNVWRGITPLKSTREDVERILGKPVPLSIARHAGWYETKDGKVFVLYSTGPCNVNHEHGWNIPELTVISISYYPNTSPRLADIKIDVSKFDKDPDPGSLNIVSYVNEAAGIGLDVDSTEDTVRTFLYFPESKYDRLMCKNIKAEK